VEIEGPVLGKPVGPLNQLLREGLTVDPDAVAIESAYRRLTWAELEEESARLAAGYLSIGLSPGDRLASLMPNRVALAVHYLACFKAGLVATPLNYRYTAREIDHALEVSAAAAWSPTPSEPRTSPTRRSPAPCRAAPSFSTTRRRK
jgi:acyl-CoA synthetase (AMP-forming)/AMP-acid ligase II